MPGIGSAWQKKVSRTFFSRSSVAGLIEFTIRMTAAQQALAELVAVDQAAALVDADRLVDRRKALRPALEHVKVGQTPEVLGERPG